MCRPGRFACAEMEGQDRSFKFHGVTYHFDNVERLPDENLDVPSQDKRRRQEEGEDNSLA